ncbi:hypothetical protein LX36DRAFT_657228 [Colletotrichum falcatum]|nr:hypothetical protein LX36DRAFT_657228 [Colletotrichum falcatum]
MSVTLTALLSYSMYVSVFCATLSTSFVSNKPLPRAGWLATGLDESSTNFPRVCMTHEHSCRCSKYTRWPTLSGGRC